MSFSSRNGRRHLKCTSSPFEKGGADRLAHKWEWRVLCSSCQRPLRRANGGKRPSKPEAILKSIVATKVQRRAFSLPLCSFGGERGMEASCILLLPSHFSLFGFPLLFPFSFLPPFFSARSPLASIGRLRGGGGGAGAYWEKEDCTDSTTKKNEEAILLHFSIRTFASTSHSFSPNSLANPVPPHPSLARTTGTTQMLQRSVEPSAFRRRRRRVQKKKGSSPLLSPWQEMGPAGGRKEGGRRPMLPPPKPVLPHPFLRRERERARTLPSSPLHVLH